MFLKFHNGGKKMYKNLNQGKTTELFFFYERKRAEIRSIKMLLQKYDEHNSVQDKQMFLKRVILWYGMHMVWYGMLWHGMLCYAMLSYAVVWFGEYGML